MTEEHKPKHDERSERVLGWLFEHRADFESAGIAESSLAAAVGLSADEVTEAVDRLENREAVARIPHHDAAHTGSLLQPARGWTDICEGFDKGSSSTSAT
jgi:hypothetical protein